ncbi:MAG: hypothetical protein KDC98_14025 [Planctomycetes bacterium]|nr:hypothetical protein [Planctomycetota bacterium]
MSLDDLSRRLERSFRSSERLLTRLFASLQQRRTAWIAARPDSVAPTAELEALGIELAAEDKARATMVGELSVLLPLPPGIAPQELHVNVSRLAAAIPAPAARSLRAAADAATAIAGKVRRELALGKRLLGFAQRAQESLLADVTLDRPGGNPGGYDRRAKKSRGLGLDSAAGSLIDGRM